MCGDVYVCVCDDVVLMFFYLLLSSIDDSLRGIIVIVSEC